MTGDFIFGVALGIPIGFILIVIMACFTTSGRQSEIEEAYGDVPHKERA